MVTLIRLATQSLLNRWSTAALTMFAIAMSVTLFLGIEQLRSSARSSFEATLSGADLLVGARSGDVNLLLYAVFRLGNPTSNLDWQTFEEISARPDVAWTIPISLGDSFRGFRVIGTNQAYFEHYRYGNKQNIRFGEGQPFEQVHDVVLGAEVARSLNLSLGDEIVLSHGIGSTSFAVHDDDPFRVTGILAVTGTPVDRAVHVSLQGLEAVHASRGQPETLEPDAITAFLVGMKSRIMTLRLQREINEYSKEALTAVIPGVALAQLWQIVGAAETTLRVVSGFVVITGLLVMLSSILTSLNERRREMALLRAVGARPVHVFALLILEAGLLSLAGALLGVIIVHAGLMLVTPLIQSQLGLVVGPIVPGWYDMMIIGGVVGLALLMGALPAWLAYRRSLADGLTVTV